MLHTQKECNHGINDMINLFSVCLILGYLYKTKKIMRILHSSTHNVSDLLVIDQDILKGKATTNLRLFCFESSLK